MGCEICGKPIGHDSRCPNYIPPAASRYCYICDGGIYNGEEYVETSDNKCVHYDCLTGLSYRGMIEWLDGEIKIMEDNNERNY